MLRVTPVFADKYGQYAADIYQIRVLRGDYSIHPAVQIPPRPFLQELPLYLYGLRRRYPKGDTVVFAVLGAGVHDGLARAYRKEVS